MGRGGNVGSVREHKVGMLTPGFSKGSSDIVKMPFGKALDSKDGDQLFVGRVRVQSEVITDVNFFFFLFERGHHFLRFEFLA